ncbi:hypothetical protein [Xanthomonas arboricola]|uniref:hypothetical protein n=1 Tax=Xanthomonas arboricola TaxID=56448 RepID=UPI0015E3F059|nr:hypothetical protein [Xanthomonas arboricola]
MARSNDLDIRATADQISGLFNVNCSAEALAMLNGCRQDQSEVVRDALDRYVGVRSANTFAGQGSKDLSSLRLPGRCIAYSKPCPANRQCRRRHKWLP